MACLCHYRSLFNGLTNRSLRELVAGLIPGYSARQATYDLRRLRRKGLIRPVPRSHRHELADHGRMIAVFFTKTHTRPGDHGAALTKAAGVTLAVDDGRVEGAGVLILLLPRPPKPPVTRPSNYVVSRW